MKKEKTAENKEMSESTRQDVSSVLNEYISKHYKNNFWFIKNMLLKRGVTVENFYIEEALQKVYIWLFLHSEKTLEFHKKGDLDNLVGSVLRNWWTLRNITRASSQNFYMSEYEVDEDKMDLFIYEEDDALVSEDKILKFLDTDLAKRMSEAAKKEKLYLEQPCVLSVPAN